MDSELNFLVDERAVLKHFEDWPERKCDALREAVATYRDLQAILAEIKHEHEQGLKFIDEQG
eukprot:2971673-Ditylum_brightwellii.AAC.1